MKLKSLTLAGFKSFVDRTTFAFDDGVTCVVGPNGCGKSNLIDAFKWVLGEQSAKSLRGGEMMDVIFNGTAQRRSAGFAEVALHFEDAAGVLDPGGDGDGTVTISRRLYRSGESEYLINKQVSRLRDIREMFMDTGVGADAYSLIEQGKVETFLQASRNERRAVFDEAAGISKYKARKREAVRRLERVEQNLLRLTDILSEVQKRLRSIKYQAGKARSYQAHSARLRELRSLFSLAEYHRLSGRRRDLQTQADALADALAELAGRIDRLEASRTGTETEIADLEQKARALDGRLAEANAQIETCRQRSEMLDRRAGELADGIATDSARLEQLEAKVETNRQEMESDQGRLGRLARQLEELTQREGLLRREVGTGADALQRLQAQLEDEKNGTIDLLRRTAQLHNEINTYGLRRDSLHTQRQRLEGRAEVVARSLEELLARRMAVEGKLEDVRAVLEDSQNRLDQTHRQAADLLRDDQRLAADISQAQQDRSGMLSRQAALEEMQQRLEGVGEGVRRVLTAARQGRLPFVRGMLAQFVETDVAHAQVIEAALAGAEQRLVADRAGDVLAAAEDLRELLADAGGVELVSLDLLAPAGGDGERVEGALARASDWVRCDPAVAPAVHAVLGRTLVVESLARAFEIARRQGGPWRFVTLAGEVLEPDGRVRIGAARSGAGVISRRSELAELRRRLAESQVHIDALIARRQEVNARRQHAEEVVKALRTAVYEANTERVEHESLRERLNEQVGELQREAPLLAEEVRQLAEEIELAGRRQREARAKAAELEELRRRRETQIARLGESLTESARRQEALKLQLTEVQVRLAEARQRRDALAETLRRLAAADEAMGQELSDLRGRIAEARQRRAEAEAGAAEARRRIQALMDEKGRLVREAEETAESRRTLAERLDEVRRQLGEERKGHDQLGQKVNDRRVQLGEVEVRIENLINRTSEELGLDLPELYPSYQHDEARDWEAVRAEIADLRGKIERLGNVNLDAIAEQDELQQREQFLAAQVEDIRASQRQLAELIKRLNAESRRRFEESFQAVRGHFGELFRKLFGGGKADILLTDPEDVLDSGIEVVARPPGKELRSISLLSGGEKTLTALALMFSFFKARPSPFCLLDEVDAALDEANTDRFANLLREFLGSSQFVIISHAKRTIAMADQIYGVTMQEPGVSVKVAVRFEDATKMTEPRGRYVSERTASETEAAAAT